MNGPFPWQDDRGSATVVMTAVVAVTLVVVGALLSAAAGRVAVVRAQGAADAGALAAAAALAGRVPGAPCSRAGWVVDASGASLSSCATAGGLARVVVAVRTGPFTVAADAVAGPRSVSAP